MFYRRVLLLFLLAFMAELAISCCDCPELTILDYNSCSLTVQNLDNEGRLPRTSIARSINKNAFGLELAILQSEFICKSQRPSLFLNSAWAISCECEPAVQYLPLQEIEDVQIISLNDFNPDHPAGSDITSLFRVYDRFEFYNVKTYLLSLQTIRFDFLDPEEKLQLLLIDPPSDTNEQQFEITLSLSDGRVLSAESPIVTLQ